MSNLKTYIKLIIASGPGIYYGDQGGYYVGTIDTRNIEPNGLRYLLFLAPKEYGYKFTCLSDLIDSVMVDNSQWNGFKNTYSNHCLKNIKNYPAIEWVNNLKIDGFDDYYIPALKELECIYFNFASTNDSQNFGIRMYGSSTMMLGKSGLSIQRGITFLNGNIINIVKNSMINYCAVRRLLF